MLRCLDSHGSNHDPRGSQCVPPCAAIGFCPLGLQKLVLCIPFLHGWQRSCVQQIQANVQGGDEANASPGAESSGRGLSNAGLRPLSAICAQSSTIVHFYGPFGALSKGNFRRKMTTIVGNCGQLWTRTLSPLLPSPHLDFPTI